MLAGAAVLFVLASGIIAFQGWPRLARQGMPAPGRVSAAPAAPTQVSRRLRAVVFTGRAPVLRRASVAPDRSAGRAPFSTATRAPVVYRRDFPDDPSATRPGG